MCARAGRNAPRIKGFTLLEALVALVILATSGMALYALLNTNLMTLVRVQDTSVQLPLVQQSIEHLRGLNLQGEESGSLVLDGATLTWRASLLEPHRESQNFRGYRGNFRLGLYDIEFELTERDGRSLGRHHLRVVGYEKIRGHSE